MSALKMGAVATALVLILLALLRTAGAEPSAEIADMAPKAVAGVIVLAIGGAVLRVLARSNAE